METEAVTPCQTRVEGSTPEKGKTGPLEGRKVGIFLDTETNGLDSTKHRIFELAIRIVDLDSGKEHAKFEAVVKQPDHVWEASDPIALKYNGFTKEKLDGGIPEKEVASRVRQVFQDLGISAKNAVFICQNPSFDRGFFSQLIDEETRQRLGWPYHWLDFASMYVGVKMTAGQEERREVLSHSLSKDIIAAKNGIPPETKPHGAMNGVDHLLRLCKEILHFPGG